MTPPHPPSPIPPQEVDTRRAPCIIFMDSLQMHNAPRVNKVLKSYLVHEWRARRKARAAKARAEKALAQKNGLAKTEGVAGGKGKAADAEADADADEAGDEGADDEVVKVEDDSVEQILLGLVNLKPGVPRQVREREDRGRSWESVGERTVRYIAAHHPSPIAHDPRPTTHHPPPTTHDPPPTTHHPSPRRRIAATAVCLLSNTQRRCTVAFRILPRPTSRTIVSTD